MPETLRFWEVQCQEGEPDLFVCLSCLDEVFRGKIPMPACPACQGISTYEAFTLDAIKEWGTEELIKKAQEATETWGHSIHVTSEPSQANAPLEAPKPE